MRSNWEWAARYALFWIIVTLFIFGAIFTVLDYGNASESVRIQSFVLLATITLVNKSAHLDPMSLSLGIKIQRWARFALICTRLSIRHAYR